MQIHYNTLTVMFFKSTERETRVGGRKDAEVSATGHRKVRAHKAQGCRRKFLDHRATATSIRVRKTLGARHAIEIVMYGIDTGIVSEPFFDQDVQCPQATLGDRPTWSTVAKDQSSRGVFNDLFCLPGIFAKLIRRETVNRPMPITMTSKLMASGLDFTHQ